MSTSIFSDRCPNCVFISAEPLTATLPDGDSIRTTHKCWRCGTQWFTSRGIRGDEDAAFALVTELGGCPPSVFTPADVIDDFMATLSVPAPGPEIS